MNRSRGNDMDDLYQELRAKMRQAEASLKALKQNGIEKARTEQEYQVKKRQEYLKRKDNGEAVTMINETIKGVQDVAEARFNRDVAEVVYDANISAINLLKLEMRIIEEQINREWGARE